MLKLEIDKDLRLAAESAAEVYRKGGVFAYPTDTIYGFGGDPFNTSVKSRIAAVKGRDESKRFILLADSLRTIQEMALPLSDNEISFLQSVWPAPVSVILPLNEDGAARFASSTAAFRIPDEKFCRELLSLLKLPVISTSINRSGEPPVTNAEEIAREFGADIDMLYFYSRETGGSASTIIDMTTPGNPRLIREGSVKYSQLLERYNGPEAGKEE